jgi:hypothetical protein
MTGPREHERQIVLTFILPQRQSRYLELLEKPKRRKQLTDSFAHFKHLDMRYAVQIPSKQQHVAEILKLLKGMGAPDNCYVFSQDDSLDGKEVALAEALNSVVGYGMGTFLSCVPGKLAYFEDEDDRFILERKK